MAAQVNGMQRCGGCFEIKPSVLTAPCMCSRDCMDCLERFETNKCAVCHTPIESIQTVEGNMKFNELKVRYKTKLDRHRAEATNILLLGDAEKEKKTLFNDMLVHLTIPDKDNQYIDRNKSALQPNAQVDKNRRLKVVSYSVRDKDGVDVHTDLEKFSPNVIVIVERKNNPERVDNYRYWRSWTRHNYPLTIFIDFDDKGMLLRLESDTITVSDRNTEEWKLQSCRLVRIGSDKSRAQQMKILGTFLSDLHKNGISQAFTTPGALGNFKNRGFESSK